MIVLPNGFNVYPEDIENALRIAGIRDSVVLETEPGRIEAVVLGSAAGGPPGAVGDERPGGRPRADRRRGQGRQRDARPEPADRRLAAVARRGLPADPHLKIKRTQVRAWVAADTPRRVGLTRRRSVRDREAGPERLERGLDPGRRRILRRARQPLVEDDRRADLADDA